MEGLLEEGEELMKERADSDVLDAALISAAQRVEHTRWRATGARGRTRTSSGSMTTRRSCSARLMKKGTPIICLTSLAERVINVDALTGGAGDREVARGSAGRADRSTSGTASTSRSSGARRSGETDATA